jgi:uncharacterized protein (UPF0332 family)
MSPENRTVAVEEELTSVEENLAAGRALIDLGLLRPAMTRVYYAVFHAARALLFAEGLESPHQGTLEERPSADRFGSSPNPMKVFCTS